MITLTGHTNLLLQNRQTAALNRGKTKWFRWFEELVTTDRPGLWWLWRTEDRKRYLGDTEELKVRTDETEKWLGVSFFCKVSQLTREEIINSSSTGVSPKLHEYGRR